MNENEIELNMKFHMLGRFEVHVIFKTYLNIYRCPSDYLGDNCEMTYDLCDLANPCVGPGSNCSVINGAIQCHCSQGNVKGSVLGIICYQEYKSGTFLYLLLSLPLYLQI